MLDWYPYVPVGGQMALNCAILSYNGVTYFGFSGDVHAAPDLDRLEHLMGLSIAELLHASGEAPEKHKTERSRGRHPVAPKIAARSATAAATPVNAAQATPQATKKEAVPLSMAAD
jgi:hypothetical protein